MDILNVFQGCKTAMTNFTAKVVECSALTEACSCWRTPELAQAAVTIKACSCKWQYI